MRMKVLYPAVYDRPRRQTPGPETIGAANLMSGKHVLLITLLLLLVGCVGRDFIRPAADSLRLGQTTWAQVEERYGKPYKESVYTLDGIDIVTEIYAYGSLSASRHRAKINSAGAARKLEFKFHNNILVGYVYSSSWAEDHTDFDETKSAKIVKGLSRKTDVMQLLGKPSGYYIYPMIEPRSGDAAVYYYTETRAGVAQQAQTLSKLLVVTFADNGLVSDVSLKVSLK
jgi:hypothetical protein